MKIAVEGCTHGELEKIYDTIEALEARENIKVDLLISCGDFQATRTEQDLKCMAAPLKYQQMCSFFKYFSGEKTVPVLTVFVGGNHESSNYLQELAYGGWVAPNIYYLGYAGVVNIAGIKIAGLSGIFKGADYLKGHYEKTPYDQTSIRSVYHLRNLEVFRLKQISEPVNLCISHEWPKGIYHYGDVEHLLRMKPFFRDDVYSDSIGSGPTEEVLKCLKPDYWFAAHHHCKFAALVPHEEDGVVVKTTRFLALDKCLPRRKFLQIIDVPDNGGEKELHYDLEWLTILSLTNHLLSVNNSKQYMPGEGCAERWKFTPTKEEKDVVYRKFNGDLKIPMNFVPTVEVYNPAAPTRASTQPEAQVNPQTKEFCEKLEIDDPCELVIQKSLNDANISRKSLLKPRQHDESATEPADLSCTSAEASNASFGKFTPLKLGLSLPKPKLDTTADHENFESFIMTPETSGVQSDLFFEDRAGAEPVQKSTPKFKRRNESIYQNPDDDDS